MDFIVFVVNCGGGSCAFNDAVVDAVVDVVVVFVNIFYAAIGGGGCAFAVSVLVGVGGTGQSISLT